MSGINKYTLRDWLLMYLAMAIVLAPAIFIIGSMILEDHRARKICEDYESARRTLPNEVIDCPFKMSSR